MTYIWIVLFVVFLGLEAVTYSLVSVWFAIGAVASFAISIFVDSLTAQLLVFAVVSLITLAFFRGPINKTLEKGKQESQSFHQVLGKTGIVTEKIDNFHATGRVSISGVSWMARSTDDDICIEEGEKVIVKNTEGVKIFVQKLE